MNNSKPYLLTCCIWLVTTTTAAAPKQRKRLYPDSITKAAIHVKVDTFKNRLAISPAIYGLALSPKQPQIKVATSYIKLSDPLFSHYNWESDLYPGKRRAAKPGQLLLSQLTSLSQSVTHLSLTIPIGPVVMGPKGQRLKSQAFKKELLTITPNTKDDTVYQDEFIHWIEHHLSRKYARVSYSLDHEPENWPEPHTPKRYDNFVKRSLKYAQAIKDLAPRSWVFGPELEGAESMRSLNFAKDAYRGEFIDYYLKQFQRESRKKNIRLLDVLSVHWSPMTAQDPNALSPAQRLEEARAIWDPTYNYKKAARPSIPGGQLIRLQRKINRYYPGTYLALSAYAWGGGQDISGALAQAETFGALASTGTIAAALRPLTAKQPFLEATFQLFLSQSSTTGPGFGKVSTYAESTNPQQLNVYASTAGDHDQEVRLIIINKTAKAQKFSCQLTHHKPLSTAQAWHITSAQAKITAQEPFLLKKRNAFTSHIPPQSLSLLALRP